MAAAESEAIANFMAITGASTEEAQAFLKEAGGDLEAAVNSYLDGASTWPKRWDRGWHETRHLIRSSHRIAMIAQGTKSPLSSLADRRHRRGRRKQRSQPPEGKVRKEATWRRSRTSEMDKGISNNTSREAASRGCWWRGMKAKKGIKRARE